MKTLFLTTIALFFQFCFAQTDVIAMRSHSGSPDKLHLEADNFGNPPVEFEMFQMVDTIIYLKDDCVIQVYQEQILKVSASDKKCEPATFRHRRDTICNVSYFHVSHINKDLIQQFYGESVTLIGFDKFDHSMEVEQKKDEKEENKEYLLPILFLLLLGPLFYLLRNIRSGSTALMLFILFTGAGITAQGQEIQIDKCGVNDDATLNKYEAYYFQSAIDSKTTGPFIFEGKRILFLDGNYGAQASSKQSFFEKHAKPYYQDKVFPHLQVIILDEAEQSQLKGYDAIIISWSKVPVSTRNRKKFVKNGMEQAPNQHS